MSERSIVGMILQWIGLAIFWTLVTVIIVVVTWLLMDKYIWPAVMYRRAKKEVTPWVESYKARCRGNNRFVVTVADLQDSFREYDTDTLKKVWNHLVEEKIIQQDPMDNEWCIR